MATAEIESILNCNGKKLVFKQICDRYAETRENNVNPAAFKRNFAELMEAWKFFSDEADGDTGFGVANLEVSARTFLETSTATTQCKNTIGYPEKGTDCECWICGFPIWKEEGKQEYDFQCDDRNSPECEHMLPVVLAFLVFGGVYRTSNISELHTFAKNNLHKLYLWAHPKCNQRKSNKEWINGQGKFDVDKVRNFFIGDKGDNGLFTDSTSGDFNRAITDYMTPIMSGGAKKRRPILKGGAVTLYHKRFLHGQHEIGEINMDEDKKHFVYTSKGITINSPSAEIIISKQDGINISVTSDKILDYTNIQLFRMKVDMEPIEEFIIDSFTDKNIQDLGAITLIASLATALEFISSQAEMVNELITDEGQTKSIKNAYDAWKHDKTLTNRGRPEDISYIIKKKKLLPASSKIIFLLDLVLSKGEILPEKRCENIGNIISFQPVADFMKNLLPVKYTEGFIRSDSEIQRTIFKYWCMGIIRNGQIPSRAMLKLTKWTKRQITRLVQPLGSYKASSALKQLISSDISKPVEQRILLRNKYIEENIDAKTSFKDINSLIKILRKILDDPENNISADMLIKKFDEYKQLFDTVIENKDQIEQLRTSPFLEGSEILDPEITAIARERILDYIDTFSNIRGIFAMVIREKEKKEIERIAGNILSLEQGSGMDRFFKTGDVKGYIDQLIFLCTIRSGDGLESNLLADPAQAPEIFRTFLSTHLLQKEEEEISQTLAGMQGDVETAAAWLAAPVAEEVPALPQAAAAAAAAAAEKLATIFDGWVDEDDSCSVTMPFRPIEELLDYNFDRFKEIIKYFITNVIIPLKSNAEATGFSDIQKIEEIEDKLKKLSDYSTEPEEEGKGSSIDANAFGDIYNIDIHFGSRSEYSTSKSIALKIQIIQEFMNRVEKICLQLQKLEVPFITETLFEETLPEEILPEEILPEEGQAVALVDYTSTLVSLHHLKDNCDTVNRGDEVLDTSVGLEYFDNMKKELGVYYEPFSGKKVEELCHERTDDLERIMPHILEEVNKIVFSSDEEALSLIEKEQEEKTELAFITGIINTWVRKGETVEYMYSLARAAFGPNEFKYHSRKDIETLIIQISSRDRGGGKRKTRKKRNRKKTKRKGKKRKTNKKNRKRKTGGKRKSKKRKSKKRKSKKRKSKKRKSKK